MSHGIKNDRDFVYGLIGQGNDWHGLTVEKPAPLTKEMFPIMLPHELIANGTPLPWKILLSVDDNKPCGNPFNPKTFGHILPVKAWDMVEQSLAGTAYKVERIGMLWDRSFWFVSVCLDELKEVARPGEAFQLNFSGGLDGNDSPQGELSHTRAVCWNTISISRQTGEYLFKIRQTINSDKRLEEVKSEVEKAVGIAGLFNKTLSQLEGVECKVEVARWAYAGELARHNADFKISTTKTGEQRENRARNTTEELVGLFQSGAGNKGETRADLLNGYTQYFTQGRKDTKRNVWSIVASSEFGLNADRKAAFFDALTDEKRFGELIEVGKEALAV